MSRLTELQRLAQAATPGPWSASCRHVNGPKEGDLIGISNWPINEFLQCEVIGPNSNVGRGDYIGPDAAYIAALSPDYILRLLAAIEAADAYRNSPKGPPGQSFDEILATEEAYDAARVRLEE